MLQGNLYRWGASALLLFAVAPRHAILPWRDTLHIVVGALCAWMLGVYLFATPAYSADALYRPVVFYLSFIFAATRSEGEIKGLFRAGVLLAVLLVLIGFAQFYFGVLRLSINPQRAAGTFITPNSFATAINFALLPMIALAATGRGGGLVLAGALWLFAGLQPTESRGGWIACAAGISLVAAYLGRAGLRVNRVPVRRLLIGLIAVAAIFWASTRIPWPMFSDGAAPFASTLGDTVFSRGSSLRMDIYRVAADLIADRPVWGYGADMFRFLIEANKPPVLDIGHSFIFVHDDYLQIWLEFGIIGIGLLGIAAGVAGLRVWRSRGDSLTDPIPLCSGAALTTVFVHALVDFPLYLPIFLLCTGFCLGALARRFEGERGVVIGVARPFPFARAALAFAFLAWLAEPAAAELAGDRALNALLAGRLDSALYWQSVARRLEPRNPAHYWTEGVIWRDQAIDAKDATLAAKADVLFAEGMRNDPYQVANFLERARFRRMHPELFGGRSESQVDDWTAQALRVRPYSQVVIAERARALDYLGRRAEAIEMVRNLVAKHPETDMARGLADEFGIARGGAS